MARDQIRPIKVAQPTLFPTLNTSIILYYTITWNGEAGSPDCTGDYFYGGINEFGKVYYERSDGLYKLTDSYYESNRYSIHQVAAPFAYWTNPATTITGDYTPTSIVASGTATVTAITT